MEQDSQYLADILHSARRILEQTADITLSDFDEDVQLQDAVVRRLLAIEKASEKISAATRQETHTIDWPALDGLKSKLMKAAPSVDADLVWIIIQLEIPALIQSISPYIPSDTPSN